MIQYIKYIVVNCIKLYHKTTFQFDANKIVIKISKLLITPLVLKFWENL